jgi:signal transduction histidine kinase
MKTWLSRIEYFIAAWALAAIGALVWWWSVFFRRLIIERSELHRFIVSERYGLEPERLERALTDVQQRNERLMLMISGETAVFLLAIVLCVFALAMVARRRRTARETMERLLQFTSHELKTPVAGVRALLQSLTLGSIPETERNRFIGLGVAECDRLEHLVETILAYQRAMARGPRRGLDVARVDELVEEILAHRAGTGISEQVKRESVASTPVRVDRDGFRVVLENLLDNARKYAAGREVTVSGQTVGRTCRLEVHDQGPGFNPADAARLFDPFRRNKNNGVTHGSGLGLYIARELAHQMGGELSATSRGPGQGATFVFELKVAEAGEATRG